MNVKRSVMVLLILLFLDSVSVHSVEGLDHGCPGSCSCFENFTTVKCVNQFGLNLNRLPSYTQELYIARDFIGPIVNHTFNHLLQLEVLDMANNGISYLQGGVFRWLRQLRVLNLRKNYLNILDDSIFEDNVQIEYLDLSHNQFSELPRTAFRYLVNLKVLNVSYNNVMSAYLNSRFQVMTHIQVLDLSGNNLDVINGSYFDIARKWDLHVPKVLNFSHCSLTYIDPQALRYVGNVHFLGLANNPDLNISDVNVYLEVMHEINVKTIDVSYTNLSVKLSLTNLDMSLLGALALEDLHLAGNGFQTLNPTALSFLNLKRLDLSYNHLSELPNFFSMSSLVFLDISHNSLTSVAGAVKDSVGNLEILIMSHNQLTDSCGLDLGNAVKLTRLDLSFNSFTSYNIPKTLKKLRQFSIAWNNIQGISVLEGLESLLYLDFSHNKLTKLDSSFLFLDSQKLISANFSRNQISSVSHQAFLPHTPRIIDLSWNELAQIRHFGWIDNIRALHFEGNKISKIDAQAFYGLHSLEYLNLGYNALAWFDSNVFQYLTNLTKLHLNRNFISEVIPLEELFHPLESLEILDLSYNNFTTFHFHSSPLTSCPSLKKLNLAGNDIKIFYPDSFQRLEYFEILDFSENPLHCSCDILPFRDWLMKTKVKILEPTNRSYVCHSPGYRTGKWLKNFKIRPFECQEYLLYTVLVFSTGGGLVVIGIIIGLVCHFWRKWRKKREETKEGPVISYKHQNGYHNPLYDIEDPYRKYSLPADIIIQETAEKSTDEKNEKKLKKQKHVQKRRHSDMNGFSQKLKAVRFHDNRGYRSYEPSVESNLESELEHNYRIKKDKRRKQSRGNRELVRMLSAKGIRSRSMPDVINYVNSLPLPNRSRYPIIPIVHIDHPDSLRRGWVQSYVDLSERKHASPNHLKARYSLGNEYTDRKIHEYHIPPWTTLPRSRISKKPYIPVNGYKVIPYRAGFDTAAALTLGRLVERRFPRSKSQWI